MISSNYTAVILPQAEKDITEILEYISYELKNPIAAKILWSGIKEAINSASLYPYAMPILNNERICIGPLYRKIAVSNYIIVYKIVDEMKEIRILSVLYGPSNIMAHVLNRL